jgi:sedoheptulose-bisphosphatase
MASNTSFIEHLGTLLPASRSSLRDSVLPALIDSISEIAKTLRVSHHVSQAGTANSFGDDQLNVDVSSENLVREAIKKCPTIVTASSEEDPVERQSATDDKAQAAEQYTLAFDPLDGSSIIAPNWTVGTIIGIWDGSSALHQAPREKQVAAVLGVYGPRTTAIIAIRTPGTEGVCIEVGINENGATDSQIIRSNVRLSDPPFKTRYFAPANLRSAAEDEQYMRLINRFIREKYTLRYIGGLVPDIVHTLVKGHGVYISPVTATSKAKLRRLYELLPIALIIECAGGRAVDPADGKDIIDRALENCDERAGLLCGNGEDVQVTAHALAR